MVVQQRLVFSIPGPVTWNGLPANTLPRGNSTMFIPSLRPLDLARVGSWALSSRWSWRGTL